MKAIDVAEYITRAIQVDPLKLQKLLFYTQAVSLAMNDVPAFDDPIEAWDYGPVVRNIYNAYKKYGFDNIPPGKNSKILDPEVIRCADMVIKYYGGKSGAELINETHSEDPWQEAYSSGKKTIITPIKIKEYYKGIFTFQ